MNNDTQIYRRVALVWSTGLTVVFGFEMFFLLTMLTGREALAGWVAAVLTVVLGSLITVVWGQIPEVARPSRAGRDASHMAPHFRLADADSFRLLMGRDSGAPGQQSSCPWAEEIEAKKRALRRRQGNDRGGRFRLE